MEEYPSNSNKSKEKQLPTRDISEKRSVELTGPVRTKKRTEMQKLADIFITEDIKNVKSYILMDVLVPSIKNAISNMVTDGIDMILFGNTGRSIKKDRPRVSYRSYNESRDHRDNIPRRNRSTSIFDYDDVEFDNRGDADAVLDLMLEALDVYGIISVGDFYDIAHVDPGNNYQVNKYGWTDLSNADVQRTRSGGYVIKLPKAMPID